MSGVIRQEKTHFDRFWTATAVRRIAEGLIVPGHDLRGKRVLICSCGSGEEPVRAANAGAAEVWAFDISETGVAKAIEVAAYNGVRVHAQVMDFHALAYPDEYFDVIYGSAILHHVDCELVGRELWRCLRPGGIAYFQENSDRNPILRWLRRAMFGKPGEVQRSRSFGFRRHGSPDEYPLTDDELATLEGIFSGGIGLLFPRFVFFELLAVHGWRRPGFLRAMQRIDHAIGALVPRVKRYSFLQDVMLVRASAGRAGTPPGTQPLRARS